MLAENPSIHSIEKLLAVIAPGSTGSAAKPLPGSYSNLTHLVEAVDPGGTVKKYVVRRYVHGDRAQKARVEHPSGHLAWARALGEMLAKIHSVPLPEDTSFLLDGNAEVVWFLKSSAVPAYMTNHPGGNGLADGKGLAAAHPAVSSSPDAY